MLRTQILTGGGTESLYHRSQRAQGPGGQARQRTGGCSSAESEHNCFPHHSARYPNEQDASFRHFPSGNEMASSCRSWPAVSCHTNTNGTRDRRRRCCGIAQGRRRSFGKSPSERWRRDPDGIAAVCNGEQLHCSRIQFCPGNDRKSLPRVGTPGQGARCCSHRLVCEASDSGVGLGFFTLTTCPASSHS